MTQPPFDYPTLRGSSQCLPHLAQTLTSLGRRQRGDSPLTNIDQTWDHKSKRRVAMAEFVIKGQVHADLHPGVFEYLVNDNVYDVEDSNMIDLNMLLCDMHRPSMVKFHIRSSFPVGGSHHWSPVYLFTIRLPRPFWWQSWRKPIFMRRCRPLDLICQWMTGYWKPSLRDGVLVSTPSIHAMRVRFLFCGMCMDHRSPDSWARCMTSSSQTIISSWMLNSPLSWGYFSRSWKNYLMDISAPNTQSGWMLLLRTIQIILPRSITALVKCRACNMRNFWQLRFLVQSFDRRFYLFGRIRIMLLYSYISILSFTTVQPETFLTAVEMSRSTHYSLTVTHLALL